MQKKNRGYKRGEPFRDATLFVIACEGAVREKEYFELLGEQSSRIRIKVLTQDDEHKSAPKWVLDSAAKYSSDVGLVSDDQLWIVMDVDRWKDDQLRELHQVCQSRSNWHLALSNPCFEVWLFMHIADIATSASSTCGEIKTELGQKAKGGYNKNLFIKKIRQAHERSKATDEHPEHFLPVPMRTKLYLLTNEIFQIIGPNFLA
jgi:hypothetical protein